MNKPERQKNCRIKTDVGGMGGGWLFGGEGVCFDSGTITTHYTFSGEKIMVEMTHNSDDPGVDGYLRRLYLGGMELDHHNPAASWGDFVPMAYYFGDGRYLYTGDRFQYYLHDHSSTLLTTGLGNTRAVISDLNDDGVLDLESSTDPSELLSIHNYYPFGMEMQGPWMQDHPASMDYLYNHKEFNFRGSLGWYDYGARWYDAALGRWSVVDPLAEHPIQIHISPYAYAWNNPILLNDPDGLCPGGCDGNVLKLVAYPYRVIGGKIARRFSKFSDEYLKGGLYITSHFSTVGGEDNVRQGDGDHTDNIVDDSAQSMGYASIRDNYVDTESLDVENLPNSPDDLMEVVTSPESGTVTPSDGSYSTEGSRGEVDVDSEDWLMKGPPPGGTDTIKNSSGELIERHRVYESGSMTNTRIQNK